MKNKLLASLTDETMVLDSFKEFAESKMDHFLDLAATIQSVSLDVSLEDYDYPTVDDLTTLVTNHLDSLDLDYHNEILLGGGHVYLGDVISATVAEAENLSLFEELTLRTKAVSPTPRYNVDPATGLLISEVKLNLDGMVDLTPDMIISLIGDFKFDELHEGTLTYLPDTKQLAYVTTRTIYELGDWGNFNVTIVYDWDPVSRSWKYLFDSMDDVVNAAVDWMMTNPFWCSMDVIRPVDSSTIIAIPQRDSLGEVMGFIDIEFAMEEISSSIHSMGSFAAGAFAMLQESVSDRLISLRDYLSDKFEDAYSDLSGSVAYIKDALTSSGNSRDLFSIFKSAFSGSKSGELLPEDHTNDPINAGDFTGASPIGPLCFDGLKKGITSTVSVAKQATKAIVSGLFSAGKALFSKAKEVITTTVINPYDIALLDKKGDNTIDRLDWRYHFEIDLMDIPSFASATFEQREELLGKFEADRVVHFDTVFANLTFYINDYSVHPTNHALNYVEGEFVLAPKSFDWDEELVWGVDSVFPWWEEQEVTFPDIGEWIAQLGSQPTYVSTDSDEKTLWRAFHRSLLMMDIMSNYFMHDIKGLDANDIIFYTMFIEHFIHIRTIKNIDFFSIATGYNPIVGDFTCEISNLEGDQYVQLDFTGFLSLYIDNKLSKIIDPNNIQVYPYTTGNAVTREPSYRIKKDSENRNAFDKFVKIAIVTIVVVTVGFMAKRALARSAKKAQLRRLALERDLSSKALDGTLTNADLKLLKKADKKVSLLGRFSQGVKLPKERVLTSDAELYGELIVKRIG